GTLPLRPGEDLYLRDVARIADGTDIPSGYALVDGRRAVYLLVNKRADASPLAVINEVRASLDEMRAAIPNALDVQRELDQSAFSWTSQLSKLKTSTRRWARPRTSPGRRVWEMPKPRCRGCWRCSVFWPSSYLLSSWRERLKRFSCLCRWPSPSP